MNLKLIDAAIKSYADDLDASDAARLDFFRALWGAADAVGAKAAEAAASSYVLPPVDELVAAYKAERPIFAEAPALVDADALAETLASLAQVCVERKAFAADVEAAFGRCKWDRVVRASTPAAAGESPSAWLENLMEVLVDDGMTEDQAHLAALLASTALRVQLEGSAQGVMRALKAAGAAEMNHPTLCPVCGSAPHMAHVGGQTSSAGRGRVLVCPQCAAAWEFDRVRCARCGTRNQAHLHFFNVEGDDAHRIATCDECGGYMRTLFSEDELRPCSYEVEDVVMARLDAIAQDPHFSA
ncbi:MAG: formate dehydrogenase accessory protein FdhE [Eggerthellaceae bacterium]|nr:formate dehydrogenase accessory protein FdhE [Eggerthellaceae bacterium]